MINNSLTVSASHVARLYLWSMMQQHMSDLWLTIPTGGGQMIPIIPSQEQPEVQTSDRPYIVYSYSHLDRGDFYELQHEQLNLTVSSQSHATVAATGKLIKRLFGQYDRSAIGINSWLHRGGLEAAYGSTKEPWMDEFKNFRFKWTTAVVSTAQPSIAEGSRVDATASVSLFYTEKDMFNLDSNS